MVGMGREIRDGDLMRPPCALNGLSVHEFRTRPTLGTAENNHWPLGHAGGFAGARVSLNGTNVAADLIECTRHELVHDFGLVAFDEIGFVAVAGKEFGEFRVFHSTRNCRVGNFVAVQMQNWEHGAIARGIEEFVECQLPAKGPVSDSPSPTTQQTRRSGLSNAAPKAWTIE